MNRFLPALLLAGAAVSLALAAGCGPARPAEAPLVFYPPPPDAPRLQFLTTITSGEQWREHRTSFTDFILGGRKGGEDQADITNPYGVAARDGKIYVCDLGKFRIHVIDVVNHTYATLGQGNEVAKPAAITIDADGTKYVCDAGKKQVLVFDAEDRFVRAMGDPNRCGPIGLAIRGDELFVADATGGKVEVWTRDGQLKRTISSKGDGPEQLRRPAGIAIGPQGHVFVTDMELRTVKEFDVYGRYVKSIGAPGDRPGYFARPKGIAIDPQGRIWVADAQWDKVQIFSPEGQLLLYFGESTRQPHGLVTPTGIALDATSIEAFRKYVSPDFEPEYLVFITNQFGVNKVSVNAFGRARLPAAGPSEPQAVSGSSK